MEMKPVDPAIVACSPSIRLTRYTREELLALRNSKHSAVTPACLFEPRILQFKIMDQRTENEHIASQLKLFTDRLRQMNINNFDPSLLQLFQNYQRTIINRKFWHPDEEKILTSKKLPADANIPNPFAMQQSLPQRHVSFMEPHQSALLDKIPSYDRK